MAPHGLILTITIALGAAFLGGFVAARLRLPPIVGYLAAGIAVSPFTPGLSADPAIANELAEVGVSLLMFGVGVHFSLDDLWAVRWVAIPGAIGQIVIATAVTALVVLLWGWTYAQGIVFGLAIAISSTVVLIRTLTDAGLLESAHGKIAVGWVVVEDLGIVVVLVLLPPLAPVLGGTAGASGDDLVLRLAVTLAKVALFGVLMIAVGTRVIPWLLEQVARTGHRELFTLAVLVVALGVAVVAAFAFEVSLALGAFLAGVAISESDLSHQAAAEALPLRDAFAVLFFVSVGMLFDPTFIVREPLLVAAVVALIVIRKWLVASGIVLALGYPIRTALIVGAGLAQIGEFSFVLSEVDRELGILPAEGHDLIIAAAIITITLNSVLFRSIEPLAERLRDVRVVRAFDDRRAGALARLERDRAEKLQRMLSSQATVASDRSSRARCSGETWRSSSSSRTAGSSRTCATPAPPPSTATRVTPLSSSGRTSIARSCSWSRSATRRRRAVSSNTRGARTSASASSRERTPATRPTTCERPARTRSSSARKSSRSR